MKLRNQLLSAYSVVFILMIIIGTVAYRALGSLNETAHWVTHTHEVIAKAHLIEKILVDMETGEQVKLNPNQVKDTFNELKSSQQNDLKLKCGQYRIDYVQADINKGFEQVLLQYLIKRQKMI